jgi:ABC-type bacteriocin/lantibiotic exporter with double-glycine peptidase domain
MGFYIVFTTVRCLLDSMVTYQYGTLMDGGTLHVAIVYVLLMLITDVMSGYVRHYVNNTIICSSIRKKFNICAYEKYSRLDYKSRKMIEPRIFAEKVSKASRGIQTYITWGFHSVIDIFCTSCQCIMTFYNRGLIWHLICLIVLNIGVYVFMSRGQMKKHNETINKIEKLLKRNQDKKIYWVELLSQRDVKPNVITDLIVETDNLRDKIGLSYTWLYKITNMINQIPLILLILSTYHDITKLTLMMVIIGKVKSTISSITSFAGEYSLIVTDITDYEDYWTKVEEYEPVVDLPIPAVLTVSKIDMMQTEGSRSYHLTCDKQFTIRQGDRICVKGAKGSGKSTFVHGLNGDKDGVEYQERFASNLRNEIIYRDQDTELPKMIYATIRDLFFGEPDTALIIKCLNICDIAFSLNVDEPLPRSLSGGQRGCILLATRIYHAVKTKAKFLILDEPDSKLDLKSSVRVMINIFEYLKDMTILVISHHNLDKEISVWTTKIYVESISETEGRISVQ